MGKRLWAAGAIAAAMMAGDSAHAGEAGDLLRTHLYAGTIAEGLAAIAALEADDPEAEFAAGFLTLAQAAEGLGQDLYRYGATAPGMPAAGMLLGMGATSSGAPANPNPEPLTYEALRAVLSDFLSDLDAARVLLEAGGQGGDYVVMLDPLQFRIDLDGDGQANEGESVASLLGPLIAEANASTWELPLPGHKTKTTSATPDMTVGFDRADSIWLAGYTQVLASQVDFFLAHDFEAFFAAYMHRIFPKSGLPMQDFTTGGMLMLDPESDADIADIVAAVHTLSFPVIEPERLAGVLGRLQSVTALSRRNWEAILAETDDERELVPSPAQTSIFPDAAVTEETVAAWMATLDTADQILAGQLLIPHWRFKQGFDLKAYFETATETDIVMILTGYGALPFLKDGPVADAQSFAEANRVFGENLLGYAFWFN
jgi:hypothetical protein